jgi:hypothetical protein
MKNNYAKNVRNHNKMIQLNMIIIRLNIYGMKMNGNFYVKNVNPKYGI